MKKRLLWIGIAGVILMPGASSCVAAHPIRTGNIQHIRIDSAFADFFADARDTQKSEFVLCLYGAVRNDTAYLNFVKPARMRMRTETRASYDSCPAAKSPTATYLGTWHGHNVPWVTWDDFCRFSDVDDKSFDHDHDSYIELMSCKGKLVARSKIK